MLFHLYPSSQLLPSSPTNH